MPEAIINPTILGQRTKHFDKGNGKHQFKIGGSDRFYKKNNVWMPVDLTTPALTKPPGFTHLFPYAQWGLAVNIDTGVFRIYPQHDNWNKYVELMDLSGTPNTIKIVSDYIEITRKIDLWKCTFRIRFSDTGISKEYIFDDIATMPDSITMGFKVVGLERRDDGIYDGEARVFGFGVASWWEKEGMSDDKRGIVQEVFTQTTSILNIPKNDMTGAEFPITVDPILVLGGPSATGIEDNYVNSFSFRRDHNNGATGLIPIRKWDERTYRLLQRWDINLIPPGIIINASTLSIYVARSSGTPNAFLYPIDVIQTSMRDWIVGTADGAIQSNSSCWNYRQFNSLPWPGGGPGGDLLHYDETNKTTFNCKNEDGFFLFNLNVLAHTITDYILSDGNLELCLRFQDDKSGGDVAHVFVPSADYIETEFRPVLTIDFAELGGVGGIFNSNIYGGGVIR